MITMHQIWLLMQRVYPEKQQGVDYVIGAVMDPARPTEQKEDAKILHWAGPEPEPNVKALLGMYGEDVQKMEQDGFTSHGET